MFHCVFNDDLEGGSEHELMAQRMNQHERYGADVVLLLGLGNINFIL